MSTFLPRIFTDNLSSWSPYRTYQERGRGWTLLPSTPSPSVTRRKSGHGLGHRRQLSLSSFGPKTIYTAILAGLLVLVAFLIWLSGVSYLRRDERIYDDGGVIPLGQSRERGREVFWWEQFDRLDGYYVGRKRIVEKTAWISEQDAKTLGGAAESGTVRQESRLRALHPQDRQEKGTHECWIDEEKGIRVPDIFALEGIAQGFPAPLFGSGTELGFQDDICYDRVHRFGPYGYGFAEEDGGLGGQLEGDNEGRDEVKTMNFADVSWADAQHRCAQKNGNQPRSVFVIRTWHGFVYTPQHIMMLRAIVNELSLVSRGQYEVHFLIQVQDDSLPIWASQELYNQTLKESLPEEFAGMGTLWSVAQMKLVYPPPFPESIVNFSGDDLYKAYRSLHFALQYFASNHPEFDYFWNWEMDIRVTGSYLELLNKISEWADKQPLQHAWERSSQFFIPRLFGDDKTNHYSAYTEAVDAEIVTSGRAAVAGPQLPSANLLSGTPSDIIKDSSPADLIVFNPLFDPVHTRWAFKDDITYNTTQRPPTRASLITATRLSSRLLSKMHQETYLLKHTMFPEMYPASIALHYGYKAITAPLPIYMDRDWPASHANIVFNNAPIPSDSEEQKAGMDHGAGHFHGPNGSVFGPGEHVFRGATYYSNAGFAGYLWRRFLGRENANGELAWETDQPVNEDEKKKGKGSGRMCLPMMIIHPVKWE